MSKKSGLLARQKRDRDIIQKATKETFIQYMTDTAVIALNQMGWGKDRLQTFVEVWGHVYDEYFDALRNVPETDYYRAKLDENVRRFETPERYKPFEERYEFLPEMRY